MRKMFALCALLSVCTAFGSVGVAVKVIATQWDEVAKIALKVSGKNTTDDAIRVTSQNLSTIAGAQGDDIAKVVARGGVEAVEQTLSKGSHYTAILMKSAHLGDDAIRHTALYADDLAALIPKYGDDVVRLNARLPGQVNEIVTLLSKTGKPVQPILAELATFPEASLPRAVGLLRRCDSPATQEKFVEGLQRGGAYFIESLYRGNARQIMAKGVTSAMVALAIGGGVGTVIVADGLNDSLSAVPTATAGAIERQAETAQELVSTEDASEELKHSYVRKTLDAIKGLAERQSIHWTLVALCAVIILGVLCALWLVLKRRKQ